MTLNEQSSPRSSGISVRDLCKRYAHTTKPAVDHFTIDIKPGEFVVLVGPSGCGKTTTLKMINRIIEPTSGTVTIDGKNVSDTPLAALRRGIGYVIQQIGLFPHMTVAQNIGILPHMLRWREDRTRARVHDLLRLVGLDPQVYASRHPRELSGGQRQRIGVARALAVDPPILLMDEPFGAVDPIARRELQDQFKRIQNELNKTVVFVTHDIDEAVRLGDRIVVMSECAQIAQAGSPVDLLLKPVSQYVRDFIGAGSALRSLTLVSADAIAAKAVHHHVVNDRVKSHVADAAEIRGVDTAFDILNFIMSCPATHYKYVTASDTVMEMTNDEIMNAITSQLHVEGAFGDDRHV